uniref:Uncharacterized protein n=1 Tax=Oryza sativa subsp. japonica TaxID=39947 RepID=Q68UR5_ORYSJ|nr:hypothetical protein [Oryza sativa Japonica Group]
MDSISLWCCFLATNGPSHVGVDPTPLISRRHHHLLSAAADAPPICHRCRTPLVISTAATCSASSSRPVDTPPQARGRLDPATMISRAARSTVTSSRSTSLLNVPTDHCASLALSTSTSPWAIGRHELEVRSGNFKAFFEEYAKELCTFASRGVKLTKSKTKEITNQKTEQR